MTNYIEVTEIIWEGYPKPEKTYKKRTINKKYIISVKELTETQRLLSIDCLNKTEDIYIRETYNEIMEQLK